MTTVSRSVSAAYRCGEARCGAVIDCGAPRDGRELDGMYGEDTPAPIGAAPKIPGGMALLRLGVDGAMPLSIA
jgi:hypothetical protein